MAAFCGVLVAGASLAAEPAELAARLLAARAEGRPIPVLSMGANLDMDTAYEVQKAYVYERITRDPIAGFKAGLTSKATQRKFGFTAPVSGVLFDSGANGDGPQINRSAFRALMIEVEIGLVVGSPIQKEVRSLAELRKCIRGVVPAIELPDLGFEDIKKVRAADIIAANVSACEFILGNERPLGDLDLNRVVASLMTGRVLMSRGQGSDAMGDQWTAAFWLVNQTIKHGWELKPGQVLLTGSLGKAVAGKPGRYEAQWSGLGKITFEIVQPEE
ncbi:MAG: fumarylacetoacetate hydrolase family protein [Kiritimatiellae bacterium]|nr:fumarylacetoacetate hydrolase family protein [Kiritimatiellia bacterium]